MRHTNGPTAVVDELQSKHPGIFGSQGGYSRCESLPNVSFTTGFLVGPLLSGALADAVGYYWMNSVLCRFIPCFRRSPWAIYFGGCWLLIPACVCMSASSCLFYRLASWRENRRYNRQALRMNPRVWLLGLLNSAVALNTCIYMHIYVNWALVNCLGILRRIIAIIMMIAF